MDQSIEYGVNMSHKIDEVIAADEAQKPEMKLWKIRKRQRKVTNNGFA